MCLLDRKTASRGRSALPMTFLRTRAWRRPRAACVLLLMMPSSLRSLCCLPGLAPDPFARVAHAFALVRLGFAELANVGRHLADLLLVDAGHADASGRRDLKGDALGRGDHHRMAETERELDLRRTSRDRSIADTDDLQVPGEPVGHTQHHVVHQAAGEAMERPVVPLVVGPFYEKGRV